MPTAKIFTTGGSQAVRLPKQYRLSGKEVHIKRVEGGLLLIDNTTTWKPLLESVGSVSEDFMTARDQLPLQRRKLS
jgi:antitoxin VapB